VTLGSASGAIGVPASVTIGAGATSASFTVTTSAVTTTTSSTLSASYAGVTKTVTFLVTPSPTIAATLSSLTLSRSTVQSGGSSSGRVALTGPAPAGGALVALTSSAPSLVRVPTGVTVKAGDTAAVFQITTGHTSRDVAATLSASYGSAVATAGLTVKAK
jgi:hypothetical protein